MWIKIASLIIKNRVFFICLTFVITVFMAWKAKDVELSYDFVKVVPQNDPELEYFKKFKEQYGEDGNIMVIGMKDSSLFKIDKFQKYYSLSENLRNLDGVKEVISLPQLKQIRKNSEDRRFTLEKVMTENPKDQSDLDSLLAEAHNVKFLEGQIWNKETGATLIAVSIDKDYLNSAKRQGVVENINTLTDNFSAETNIRIYKAGLPYVRAIMVKEVQQEFKLFLILAAFITSCVLFFFFRSWIAVFITFLIITVTVIWTMGTVVAFGYKITLLTGILPAVIIVIGIPNCIYMFNKYHQEFKRHKNKVKALSRVIHKVGVLTLMTNTTTAIGFLVLAFGDVEIVKEFGLVAGVISLSMFLITIVVIPSLLLVFPSPKPKQLKHLDLKILRKVNHTLEQGSLRFRPLIYVITIVVISISIYGITKLRAESFMVDDLPAKSDVKTDLKFLENNFGGVMPLEIVVDMKNIKRLTDVKTLKKLEEFNVYLNSLENVSAPLSILNIIKGATQAFFNGSPSAYRLPSKFESKPILGYMSKKDSHNDIMKSLIDSTGKVRFTAKVADLGTRKTEELVNEQIIPRAAEIFKGTGMDVKVTGTTLLFLKGNQHLINGLTTSLMFAFFLISILMALLFRSIKMVLISLIPNLIPIIITVGIMGLFNIPIKPSTALIFSIAFGIAVDDTIHYLSKYRQELIHYKGNVLKAVTRSLEEAGVSMIYTSIVLFFGFVIFAWSDFGGTVALGLLTSMTLLFAMITNLTILPSLLITFSKGYRNNLFPLVNQTNKFYLEEEDEEIDLSKLSLEKSELRREKI